MQKYSEITGCEYQKQQAPKDPASSVYLKKGIRPVETIGNPM